MGTGYVRNDSANNIADGNVINASDLDGEFDAIAATLATSGHTHDGTAAEGGPVTVLGPAQDFVATASEIKPKTDNTLDIGTASLEFKDLFIDGTAHIDVLDVDETASITGVLTTTATQVATGGITSGSNIVSDTDSTDDLGTTGVRWANLYVDGITATDQITATGFTGTLDGILGSGAAAAATVTTLDTSGAVNLNLVTDSTSSTSGALIVDGGVGIAKKLFVGTDLDVAGAVVIDTTALVTGALTANGGVIFNNSGDAAPDFRVETNDFDHMFFINGGLNNTAIGFNALPENQGVGLGILTGSGNGGVHLFREDGSFPSADESLGSFGWSGADSSGNLSTADAKITAFANENMAAGDAGTNIKFYTKADGVNQGTAPTVAMTIASTGDTTFAADVNVGTDLDVTGNAVIDGTALVTGVLTTTAAAVFNGGFTSNGDTVTLASDNANDPVLIIKNASADNTSSRLHFIKDGGRNATNGDDIGQIDFIGDNAAQEQTLFGRFESLAVITTDGAEGGKLRMRVATHDGELQTGFEIFDGNAEDEIDVNIGSGTASNTDIAGNLTVATTLYVPNKIEHVGDADTFIQFGSNEFKVITGNVQNSLSNVNGTIFNENSSNLSFRVESNDNPNMLFVDGANNRVGIGTASPNAGLQIQGADGSVEATLVVTANSVASAGLACDAGGLVFGAESGDGFEFRTGATAADPTDTGTTIMEITSGGVLQVGEIMEQTHGTDINLTMVSEDSGLAIMCRSATNGHTPYITMMKTPATSGNYTATASGDFLGVIDFRGVNTSAVSDVGASITVKQTGTASGAVPAAMTFFTTEVERMRIEDDGNIAINGAGASFVATNSYHVRIVNTENQVSQLNYNSNASFTQDLHSWDTIRAGSTDFNFGRWRSNVGGSPDSEYIFNGLGTATADGAWNGGGADYAEYFEWADGNSSSQDRVGISVKLDGTKIVASTSSDDASAIIGVISANPSVVGDTAGLKWQSKYERDDYNRYIWEEYTVTEWAVPATETEEEVLHSYQTDFIPSGLTAPDDATVILKDDNNKTLMRRKLNSDFDSSVTYVTRSDRKEWDMVGLMGKLRMTKGQKTGANWIKMKDISDTVEEWLVR